MSKCKVIDLSREPYYKYAWGSHYLTHHTKEVECDDWEFNPMHGMMECNKCGKVRDVKV